MKIAVAMILSVMLGFAKGELVTGNRPDPSDAPGMARWLVSLNDWGVLRYVFFYRTSFTGCSWDLLISSLWVLVYRSQPLTFSC